MATAKKTSAADRQQICRKLTRLLKQRYKTAPPTRDEPILETLLYAICLEDSTPEQAQSAFDKLQSSFHDLNEIRVSSISELTEVLKSLSRPEFRALEIRSALQHVFESEFAFNLESLRRRTLDLATKQLARINNLSPFVRSYTLQEVLGAHLTPADQPMANAAAWLGLVNPGADPEQATAGLKSAVRKADVRLFCHLLRMLATDSRLKKTFAPRSIPEEGYDPHTAPQRLAELFESAGKRAKTKTRTTRKKTAARPAGKKAKPAAKKTAATSSASSKSVRKKKPAARARSRKAAAASRKKKTAAAKSKTTKRKTKTPKSAAKKKSAKSGSSRKTTKRSRTTSSR